MKSIASLILLLFAFWSAHSQPAMISAGTVHPGEIVLKKGNYYADGKRLSVKKLMTMLERVADQPMLNKIHLVESTRGRSARLMAAGGALSIAGLVGTFAGLRMRPYPESASPFDNMRHNTIYASALCYFTGIPLLSLGASVRIESDKHLAKLVDMYNARLYRQLKPAVEPLP